jgi:hypothetical protein
MSRKTCGRYGVKKCAYKLLVRKLKRRKPLGRYRTK